MIPKDVFLDLLPGLKPFDPFPRGLSFPLPTNEAHSHIVTITCFLIAFMLILLNFVVVVCCFCFVVFVLLF